MNNSFQRIGLERWPLSGVKVVRGKSQLPSKTADFWIKAFVRHPLQKTTATAANVSAAAAAASVPAPAPAAAAAAAASQVDPEKAKQLTQAVAEQVRTSGPTGRTDWDLHFLQDFFCFFIFLFYCNCSIDIAEKSRRLYVECQRRMQKKFSSVWKKGFKIIHF